MVLGPRMRERRTALGLSQEAVARKAGLSLNLVNKLENGVVTDPHYSTLVGLAGALGVAVGELVREPVPLAGASETGRPPLIERKAVQDWLRQVGASFALMAREDFEELVVETLDSEGLEELAEEIDDERGRIERELGKPAVSKALFPPDMRGLSSATEEERIHEVMRPAREAGQLRLEIGRKYTTKKLAIENYSLRLYADAEAENYLLLVRPGMPEATRRELEEARAKRQAAVREELAGVGA
jgi:transcriptional regulator with XRE-family HTH domain